MTKPQNNEQAEVILVNTANQAIGTMDKIKAHKEGKLHRAFSVFLYRHTPHGTDWLLQQRATHKYHSGGLWTNTCCSHPRPDESIEQAAKRRLHEELNIQAPPLRTIGSTQYHLTIDDMIEHEHDTLLIAEFNQAIEHITPNPDEVMALRWQRFSELTTDLQQNPHQYTQWLPYLLNMLMEHPITQSQPIEVAE